MELTEKERVFLDRRRRLLQLWPPVGYLLLSALSIFTAWLFWKNPLLVNPYLVWKALQSETLEDSSLILMAGMLPVVMLLTLLVCLFVVLFVFTALHNEKRELELIARLLER
ncbi:MAG: hypothetical protein KDI74_15215 [Gammaproteobacteria bacterium]|nr:hypothetical protein [Gammaproteobacteria bacterium]HXK55181.1 hypothetical protein [Gammaproteobacteria bacterium]